MSNPVFTHRSKASRVVLGGVVGLLVAGLIYGLGEYAARREAQFQAAQLVESIADRSAALRESVKRYAHLAATVAPEEAVLALLLEPGDPERQRRVNRSLQKSGQLSDVEALYLMDRSGLTLASSNWHDPVDTFVGLSFSNRPYFIDAMAGRAGYFYGIGKKTLRPGLFISAPVRHDGEVIGVVAVKVSRHPIEESWAGASGPVVLVDRHGVIVQASVPSWMYAATRRIEPQALQWIRQHEVYFPRKEVSQFPAVDWVIHANGPGSGYLVDTMPDGSDTRRYIAVDGKAEGFGLDWTWTVMADHAPVIAARNKAWIAGALATLAAGVVLLGTLYWRLRERRYADQLTARIDLEAQVERRTHELQTAHAFRKAMEDSLLVGMRARDLAGRIIYVNPALCDMVGRSADELMGRLPPYPYWHPEDLAQHQRVNDEVLSGRAAPTGFESRLRHSDGHDVHTMVYTAPLIDGAGVHSGWMSSVVDITAQKRADERQRQQEERLQRAERLAILGEIGSMLAHELNQPLTAITSYASAAEAFLHQGNAARLQESVAGIKGQTQRAADIVRRVREMIRQRAEGTARTAGLSATSINQLVTSALGLLQADLQKAHVRVEQRLGRHLPSVCGDPVLLGQVVLNLVLNSLQALHDVPQAQRVIEIETLATAGAVQLRVLDSGPGIPASVAGRLFEPFYTTKKDGLGLGLNICRTIVESHLGELSFDNRPGGGAVFTIRLEAGT